jgi:nitrogen fixation protein FixH
MTQSAKVSPSTSKRRPGWWYPFIFVGAFGVVLAVNLVFMFSAVRSFSGLSTEQAYDKGLKYNEEIASAKRQQDLGWNVTTEVNARAPSMGASHSADIVIGFLDKDGTPVTGLSVQATFVRPTSEGNDSSVALAEQGQGRYLVSAALPLGGQWDMTVKALRGNLSYRFAQRIYLP